MNLILKRYFKEIAKTNFSKIIAKQNNCKINLVACEFVRTILIRKHDSSIYCHRLSDFALKTRTKNSL